MSHQRTERRATGAHGPDPVSGIVTKSLLVQRRTGTVGAIEYLKANGVHCAVIQRVLGGTAVRGEDRQALRDLAPA